MKKAKNVRRAVKSAFVRALNAGQMLLDSIYPLPEFRDAFEELKAAYADLIAKHGEYTMFLEDEESPAAESWMEECTLKYVNFSMRVNDYCNKPCEDKEKNAASVVDADETEVHRVQEAVVTENEDAQSNTAIQNASVKPLLMKHEKPKMPAFHGDVRKYFIFKADFQNAVEKHYSELDAITILRSCLGPEPARLVDGISTGLKAAWNYLDQNYGDPRIVSNVVTADLERFKAIQPGEEHRLCDLVNLVGRSYNILKEVKRPRTLTTRMLYP